MWCGWVVTQWALSLLAVFVRRTVALRSGELFEAVMMMCCHHAVTTPHGRDDELASVCAVHYRPTDCYFLCVTTHTEVPLFTRFLF